MGRGDFNGSTLIICSLLSQIDLPLWRLCVNERLWFNSVIASPQAGPDDVFVIGATSLPLYKVPTCHLLTRQDYSYGLESGSLLVKYSPSA